MHMRRSIIHWLRLIAGMLCIFPLLYDVVIVRFFEHETRIVAVLKAEPFSLGGEFIMNITFLLFVAGAGICYFAMKELLL